MNLRRIQYHCSCGSCNECTGGNALSYFEGMTQIPNIEQIVPIPGPAGEGSVLTAGKTDSSGVLNANGTDEALDATAKANLLAADFDITAKSTTQNVVDTTDLNNSKVWTGLSKGFLNLIGLKILPKLLPNFGTIGNILKDNGTAWVSSAPDWEKYNTTTTSPYVFTGASVGASVPLTVGAGLAYRFKHVVAVVDPSNSDKYMEGVVESYSGTLLTIKIKNVKGTGNTSGYNVMLTAPEYLPYVNDPANYGKFFYNNSGVIEMRTSIESVGDTKIWFSATAPDTSWWLCDGTPKTITESPELYNLLVTQNNGVLSPFYISSTSFRLPNATGAALVGVKTSGSDSITLGQILGNNILSGGILAKNLPLITPWGIPDHAHMVPNSMSNTGGTSSIYAANVNENAHANTDTNSVTIVPKRNNILGGQTFDGAQDLDIRQSSLGVFLFIKAL